MTVLCSEYTSVGCFDSLENPHSDVSPKSYLIFSKIGNNSKIQFSLDCIFEFFAIVIYYGPAAVSHYIIGTEKVCYHIMVTIDNLASKLHSLVSAWSSTGKFKISVI